MIQPEWLVYDLKSSVTEKKHSTLMQHEFKLNSGARNKEACNPHACCISLVICTRSANIVGLFLFFPKVIVIKWTASR